jgi:hypothetical protein
VSSLSVQSTCSGAVWGIPSDPMEFVVKGLGSFWQTHPGGNPSFPGQGGGSLGWQLAVFGVSSFMDTSPNLCPVFTCLLCACAFPTFVSCKLPYKDAEAP